MPPTYDGFLRSRKRSVSGVLRVAVAVALQEPERDERVEEVARRARVQAEAAAAARSKASGPRASSVNTPISMALSRVFEAQKARPVCRIFSGVRGAQSCRDASLYIQPSCFNEIPSFQIFVM